MSKAKDDVMKLIERKKNKNFKSRKKHLEAIGIDKIVADLIKEVNNIPKKSWPFQIQSTLDRYHSMIKIIDPDVSIVLSWSSYDKDHDNLNAEDSYLDGVTISWSESFLKLNPTVNKDIYIDIVSLFIQNLID